MKNRLIVFLFVVSCLILAGLYYNGCNQPKLKIDDLSQETMGLGLGYGLQINKLQGDQNSQYDGRIFMDSPQDMLEVEFENRGNSGQYILKLFYDYEEVAFRVSGDGSKYDTSYIFNVENAKSIKIPIELDANLQKDSKSHKIVVAVYASPEKNAQTLNAVVNNYGIVLDYEVIYDEENSDIHLGADYVDSLKSLDIEYEGLVINNNFENLTEVSLPPVSLKVKQGEEIQLAFVSGKYEEFEDYLIVSLLDWKQISMSEKPYLLLKNNPSALDYGTFSITAPDEEGLYEFVAFIVPDPMKQKNEDNFQLIDLAYRFTIEVE